MDYIQAEEKDIEVIYELVQQTIKDVYPAYYPQGIVDFFCQHHSKEEILRDIQKGIVGYVMKDHRMVGTGCYDEDHITRVYVPLSYQKQGIGSFIIQCLEDRIALHYTTAYLDASLPACALYEHKGYQCVCHENRETDDGCILCYAFMKKQLVL